MDGCLVLPGFDSEFETQLVLCQKFALFENLEDICIFFLDKHNFFYIWFLVLLKCYSILELTVLLKHYHRNLCVQIYHWNCSVSFKICFLVQVYAILKQNALIFPEMFWFFGLTNVIYFYDNLSKILLFIHIYPILRSGRIWHTVNFTFYTYLPNPFARAGYGTRSILLFIHIYPTPSLGQDMAHGQFYFLYIFTQPLRSGRTVTEHIVWTEEQWNMVHFSDESKFNLFGSDGKRFVKRKMENAYFFNALRKLWNLEDGA